MHILGLTFEDFDQGVGDKSSCYPVSDRIGKSHKNRSKETIKILKELGVVGFISTKKGTNSMKANWDMIRRIELRRYTPEKFKINLLIARNLILGKIYGWIS